MAVLEACRDRFGGEIRGRKNRRAKVLQQNGIELHDRLGDSVVLLHQLFTGPAIGRCCKAEFIGEGRLIVEEDTVFTASDLQMQVHAQTFQK